MINGKTKVFGLLGNPIKHTISPFIHGLLYRVTGYNGTYNPFFVEKGMLDKAIGGMVGLGLEGLNVTVPFKVEVMELLDEVDEMAASIGAVNTVVRVDGGLKGYNTDWSGLKLACDYEAIPIKGMDVVIVGAGGSARAVAFMCLKEGARSITILNRTVSKAVEIAGLLGETERRLVEVGELVMVPEVVTGSLEELELVKDGSVAFQTTSVGLSPSVERTPIDDVGFFRKVDFIVDIIYNPKETAFMKLGLESGVKVANGLGMLFFQAVQAFELWTGERLSDEQLSEVFRELENFVYGKVNE